MKHVSCCGLPFVLMLLAQASVGQLCRSCSDTFPSSMKGYGGNLKLGTEASTNHARSLGCCSPIREIRISSLHPRHHADGKCFSKMLQIVACAKERRKPAVSVFCAASPSAGSWNTHFSGVGCAKMLLSYTPSFWLVWSWALVDCFQRRVDWHMLSKC